MLAKTVAVPHKCSYGWTVCVWGGVLNSVYGIQ